MLKYDVLMIMEKLDPSASYLDDKKRRHLDAREGALA
jgi:hypothetical protein